MTLLFGGYYLFTYLYSSKPKSGKLAPNIEATLLNGKDFKLDQLKGKNVVLVFWGSWCMPCRIELPEIIDLQKSNQGNFEIVSIALEKTAGNSGLVAQKMGFNWNYQLEESSDFVMTNKFAKAYGVTDIPANFLIDENGILIGKKSIAEIKEILLKK